MDYIVNINGVDILIETTSKEPVVERSKLFDNYLKIKKDAGEEIDAKTERILKEIAFSLSENDAKIKNEKISKAEADFMTRMMVYANKIKSFSNLPEIKAILDPVDELIEAYQDFDFDKEKTVEINGNHFTYNPQTIDIDSISDKLFKMGEKHKGNYWRVEIADNGEVVLYW